MKGKIRNTATLFAMALALATGAVHGQVNGKLAGADGHRASVPAELAGANSIAGSWYVEATPDGAPPFRGMITFSDGGGVIASAQGDIIQFGDEISPATAGHGEWIRTGSREFLFTFRQIFYVFDDAGNNTFVGGNKVRHTARLNKAGTAWTGEMTVEFLDHNDNVVFTGSGSGTATRITVEPLSP